MQPTTKVFIFILALNLFGLNFLYFSSRNHDVKSMKTGNTQGLFTRGATKEQLRKFSLKLRGDESKFFRKFKSENPFVHLGAYEPLGEEYFNASGPGKPDYTKSLYQIFHDSNYCANVDTYNIEFSKNMFERRNFYTDYGGQPRSIIEKFGNIPMKPYSPYAAASYKTELINHLDPKITHFFIENANFHFRYEIGKEFLCVTQTFNRIPGHEAMVRKDFSVDGFSNFAAKLKDKPECIPDMFPKTYRLYDRYECREFFELIQSSEYRQSLKKEPLQYLLKKGHDSHRSDGVYLMDEFTTSKLLDDYEYGAKCGYWINSVIAQRYVSNPLLLDMNNKFDFRVYMLVASTNPLIAFYHDGILRAALSPYDKNSKNRGTHLTNTHLAAEKFKEAREHKVNGMTEQELKEYHLWTFTELQDYLLESNKIKDKKWLDNYLRPAFQKAFVHILRANRHHFWKGSNVYQLFGLDFMLDDNLNLWYIECNPNPQLPQNTKKASEVLMELTHDIFDIVLAYYNSRMSRVKKVIVEMFKEVEEKNYFSASKWVEKYESALKNRLEKDFPYSASNSWVKIVDYNLPLEEKFMGHVSEECMIRS